MLLKIHLSVAEASVRMANSAMGMLAPLARDLQWKIFMRHESMVLMVKLLAFLEFLMVYLHNSLISPCPCIHATYHKTMLRWGHGGARAAEYVKQNLFSNLIRHPKFISDTKSAIADAYNHTDTEFLKSENNQNRDAGSTASTAILVGDRLLVANVGDSRAVICRGGNAIAVSRDHKPDQTDERQRIEDAGGFVMWAGTWRVGGVLAVSRAFGDRLLKQYVVADPEIQEEKVDSSLEFLILASDGLWDVVSNEEAVAMTKPIEDAEEAAKRLMQEAYQRGSSDNITCVVVRFLMNQGASSRSNSG
ncbi:probable protein phosphatase 2C 59 isoform X1 [Abrus precatorius]|uniref:Probable protein phosphatase 2C 59 isoform X1 n=1 Tax=Abrus precatorius TaxID=3816 RepID=A0A8B8JD64_ABRPR|nr:probable protein phosphatase 2C 59 isoform X1 [Abrus precatorius]